MKILALCALVILFSCVMLHAKESTNKIAGYESPQEMTVNGKKLMVILTSGKADDIPLVVWSGGAGTRGYDPKLAIMLAKAFSKGPFHPAILTASYENHISPGFDNGKGLLAAVDMAAKKFKTEKRFMLAGFSRGGQFTHRFLLHAAPERLIAAVPCNPGTWTLPTGGALIRNKDNSMNMKKITRDMPHTPSTKNDKTYSGASWAASLAPAKPEAKKVPVLVICTKGDTTRLPLARAWVEAAKKDGFHVESDFTIEGGHRVTTKVADRIAAFLSGIQKG